MRGDVRTKRRKARNYSREDDLTVEELRAYPMFAHFSDEQALEAIDTIRRFTEIAYEFYQRNRGRGLDLGG